MKAALDHPIRLRWILLLAAAGVGSIICCIVSSRPGHAAGSYLGGLVLVVAAFEFGAFNIRLTGRLAPSMTMAVALASYLTTAVALALVLAASSPRVVSGLDVSLGLFVGLTIWLLTLICDSWVRGGSQEPVNIRARDETFTTSRSGRRP